MARRAAVRIVASDGGLCETPRINPLEYTFRSPELPVRVAIPCTAGAGAILAVGASGAGGIGRVASMLAGVILWAYAWRTGHMKVVATTTGLCDQRAFSRRCYLWSDVATIGVARSDGLREGYFIAFGMADGATTLILASRVYARWPSGRHIKIIKDISRELDQLRSGCHPRTADPARVKRDRAVGSGPYPSGDAGREAGAPR